MKKIIFALLFSILILTGCGKDKEKLEDTNTETIVDKEYNIEIFTKNEDIEYTKNVLNEDKEKIESDNIIYFANQLEENKAYNISYDETIRIDFLGNIPQNLTIEKIEIKEQDKTITTDKSIIEEEIKEDGTLDFANIYDREDKNLKGIIYNITIDLDQSYLYSFATSVQQENPQVVEKTEATEDKKIAYLTKDEQPIYDKYKKEKDDTVLKNLDPITVAKFYVQAQIEKDYETAYTLYIDEKEYIGEKISKEYIGEKISKELFIETQKNMDKALMEENLDNLKALEKGKFIPQDENSGYIEYETQPDHPMAFNMVKNSKGIWQVGYMPIN